MKSDLWKKGIILGIIILFVGTSILPNAIGLSHLFNETQYDINRIPNSEKLGQNNPPIIEDPFPENGAIVDLSISELHVLIEDPDEDEIDWTIKTSPNIGNQSGTVQGKGRVYCSIHDLKYSTQYLWFVNVTDGKDWTRKIYTFTTDNEPNYTPTIANIYIEIVKKIGGNEALVGIENVIEDIFSWSTLDNQVKIKWYVKNEDSLDYEHGPITVKVRIREYQENSFFPEYLFWFTESGRIGPPEPRFVYVDIPISDNDDSGERIINVELTELDEMRMAAMILFVDPHARPFIILRTSSFYIYP